MDLLKVLLHCYLLVRVLVIKKFLIYLDRKYEKFIYFRQLYEKSYRPIQTNIGEGCDANTEITTETKESVAS